jgi:hypothetical protein
MTKVITSEDCGNSPKNIFVQDVTIALAQGDRTFVLNSVTDNIRWNIVGENAMEGREDLAAELERTVQAKPAELVVDHVVTHGKAGAVNGTLKLKSGQVIAFCNVYEFTNAKAETIQQITSYKVKIK